MKRVILFVVLTAFGLSASAKEKKEWAYSDGVLQTVFAIEASSKATELVRLYDDGTYEHLKYTQKTSGKEEVQRNLGTYEIKKLRITFHAPGMKDFTGKFRYGSFFYNGRLYNSLYDMKARKKNEAFKRTDKEKYLKPFFICLNSDRVVSNREAAEQLDLKRLTDYLLAGKRSEEEKAMTLTRLIVGSVEYDHEGLKRNIYANDQSDVKSIIAGRTRLAVCEGYANTFKALCDAAGLSSEKVLGHTRQTFSEMMLLGGYHAWNIVELDGEKRLFDVTWADDGETIDMRWIDVDPLIMISSHFPDMAEHQLLSRPLTQEQFLASSLILPLEGSVAPISMNIPGRQFAGKNFRIVLPGKHTVKVSLYPSSVVETVYTGEASTGQGFALGKQVGSGHFDGDSTYFTVPLTEAVNPLHIDIDGKLEVRTIVFRGGQTDLMKYYISKANRQHSDAYIKGVIAAIRIGDEKTLKQLVGDDNTDFFDKKGKLKIDKSVLLACLDWTGDLTALTENLVSTITVDENGVRESVDSKVLSIGIPGKLSFELGYDGLNYGVINVMVLK